MILQFLKLTKRQNNMDNNKIVDHLNDILKRNYDAEEGYKKAAENVENSQLVSFFQEQAQNRYDFGHKVKKQIRSHGGEPNKGTSMKGDIHRAWISFRESLSSGNQALLKECKRGEKSAIEEYDELLNDSEVPESVKSIFRDQKSSIQTALQKLKRMEGLAD